MGQIPTVTPSAAAEIAAFVFPDVSWTAATDEHLRLYSLGTGLLHVYRLRQERDRLAALPAPDPHQLSVAEDQAVVSATRLGRRYELSPPQVSFLLSLTARGHLNRRRLDQVRSALTAARVILD